MADVATRETRLERGRRRGRETVRRLVAELSDARKTAALSQESLARAIGSSQSDLSRLERLVDVDRVSFVEIAKAASVLGLELGVSLHPVGDPIRDKGHQAVIRRFRALLSSAYRVFAEALLPREGDRRSWDLLLRLADQIVGVEVETRIRDVQALVRRMHQRERDGGAHEIVLVLAATKINRLLLPELLVALGPSFATPPRAILRALRNGERLPGSGVVLL
jgi:transcriptional regulator with XRE-family HTH domain